MKLLSALCFAMALLTVPAAAETDAQGVSVTGPYAFATMPGSQTGAIFMTINNGGAQADRLVGVKSKIAGTTELHQNVVDPDDGTMMMRKVAAIDIPAGENVELSPDGYHVMLIDLKEPLVLDKTIPVVMTFENAGTLEASAHILAPGVDPNAELSAYDQQTFKAYRDHEKDNTGIFAYFRKLFE
jgi:copper(I)-binding protein